MMAVDVVYVWTRESGEVRAVIQVTPPDRVSFVPPPGFVGPHGGADGLFNPGDADTYTGPWGDVPKRLKKEYLLRGGD